MKPDFQYYICDKDGRSYYVRPDGIVSTSSLPEALRSTPDGWQEISIKLGRSRELLGVMRLYTVPLKAVREGSKIIKHINYTQGVNAVAYLVIAQLNRDTDIYEPYITGQIDNLKFLDANHGATINIMEGGLVKMIRANQTTEYEIPLDVPEAVTLVNDGIELKGNRQYLANNGASAGLIRSHVVGLIQLEGEGQALVFGTKTTTRTDIVNNTGTDIANTDQWFLQPTVSGDVEFEFDLNIYVTRLDIAPGPPSNVSMDVSIRVQDGNTVTSATLIYQQIGIPEVYGPNILVGKLHHITGTSAVNVPEGHQVYLITRINPMDSVLGDVNTTIDYRNDLPNSVKVNFNSRYQRTKMKVLRPEYLFKQLISKISDGKYTGESTVLAGELKDFVMTSGDGIRGLEGAVLKISLSNFLKSYDSSFALGMGIADTIATIEKQKFYYSDDGLIDLTPLGDVEGFECNYSEEDFYSEIHIGSPNEVYDDVNGRNETNTTFKWTTPYISQTNVLDKVSPARKDAYGIEFERINLTNKKTTDSQGDNKAFMLNIAPTAITTSMTFINDPVNKITLFFTNFQSVFPGSLITIADSALNNGGYTVVSVEYIGSFTEIIVAELLLPETSLNVTLFSNEAGLNRPQFDAITGVISPLTIYNTLLSPKRALLAHGPYLRSGLDLQDAEYIRFRTADKNKELSTTLDGVTIVEKADVQIASLGAKLFRPYIFKFNTRVPLNLMQLVEASANAKYGKIKFSWKGYIFYGYLLEIGQVPQLNPVQSWELLCAPETNLLPLINAE